MTMTATRRSEIGFDPTPKRSRQADGRSLRQGRVQAQRYIQEIPPIEGRMSNRDRPSISILRVSRC